MNKFYGLRKYLKSKFSLHKRILCFLVMFSALLFLQSQETKGLSEGSTGKIVVLNSDMSITKYSLAHTGFKSKLKNPDIEIDLGSKWIDESHVKETIRKFDPDIVYCIGSKAYSLAHEFAGDKTLVFSSIINWRRLPLTESTYGISSELLPSMQITMYRYFFPEIRNIGILYSRQYNKEWLRIAKKSARELGLNLIARPVRNPDDIESNLQKVLPNVDALWLTPDPVVLSKIKLINSIFQACDRAKIPVFAYSEAFVDLGATLIISADIPTIGKQAARMVVDLLYTQKNLNQVYTPAGSHISLNIKKVHKYYLKLNIEALDSVNQIIE